MEENSMSGKMLNDNQLNRNDFATIVRLCSDRWINAYENALNRTLRDLDNRVCNYSQFCAAFDECLLDEIRILRFCEE